MGRGPLRSGPSLPIASMIPMVSPRPADELARFARKYRYHPEMTAGRGNLYRDKGRIDGSDRDAGDPIRREPRLGQRLVDARLVGTKGAAPLQ